METFEQTWFRFDAATIRDKAPNEPGVYVIRDPQEREYPIVIAAAEDLQQALLDVLPPLGSNVRFSTRIAKLPLGRLQYSFRVVLDKKKREELANLLVVRFEPASNTEHW